MSMTSPPSSSPSPSPSPLAYLRECINRKYHRDQQSPWSYLEESLLAEIARRPMVLQEMKELFDFHDSMPWDRKRFFPQTVGALLEKWTGALDIARAERPENKTLQTKTMAEEDRQFQRLIAHLDAIDRRPK